MASAKWLFRVAFLMLPLMLSIVACPGFMAADDDDETIPGPTTEAVDGGECDFSEQECVLTEAESFFPLHECIWWEFWDGNYLYRITVTGTTFIDNQKWFLTDFNFLPFVIPEGVMCILSECYSYNLTLKMESDGVHFWDYLTETAKLFFKRDVTQGETYMLYDEPITVTETNADVTFDNETIAGCNQYVCASIGLSSVCYNWGLTELFSLPLIDTNVDEYMANCEVRDD